MEKCRARRKSQKRLVCLTLQLSTNIPHGIFAYGWLYRFSLLLLTTWSSDSPRLIGDYSISLFSTLFLMFSAFPYHAWINIADSLHFTNSHVFSRQQTCQKKILSTIFFVSGIATLLQTTSGVRLIFFFYCNFWIVSKSKRSWSHGDRLLLRQC